MRGPDDVDKNLNIYPARKVYTLPARVLAWSLTWTPVAARNIYSWSNYTPLGKVRVVMIGQDPYHGPGQAHGTRTRRHFVASCPTQSVHDFLFTPCAFLLQSLLFRPTWCPGAPIA